MSNYIKDSEGLLWPLTYDSETKTWANEHGEAPFVIVHNHAKMLVMYPCSKCGDKDHAGTYIVDEAHVVTCLPCALVPPHEVDMVKTIDFVMAQAEEEAHEEEPK